MKKITIILSILLLFGLTAFQCGDERDCCAMPCSEKSTLNGTWRLTAFQNVATGVLENDPDPKGKGVVYIFADDEKEGKIEGHTFVNTVSGSYTLTSGCAMELKSFGGSKVGEPGWSSKAWLMAGTGTYSVQQDKMVITLKNATDTLIFTKLK